MVHDEFHPDVSLSDWEAYRDWVSPHPFEEVLDRSKVRLPDWYLPLARGAAIPDRQLLSRAGYRAGSGSARAGSNLTVNSFTRTLVAIA